MYGMLYKTCIHAIRESFGVVLAIFVEGPKSFHPLKGGCKQFYPVLRLGGGVKK